MIDNPGTIQSTEIEYYLAHKVNLDSFHHAYRLLLFFYMVVRSSLPHLWDTFLFPATSRGWLRFPGISAADWALGGVMLFINGGCYEWKAYDEHLYIFTLMVPLKWRQKSSGSLPSLDVSYQYYMWDTVRHSSLMSKGHGGTIPSWVSAISSELR